MPDSNLSAAIAGGKIPHAILLEGNSAAATAEYIAGAAVCSAAHAPCGICRDCKKAADRAHPDIKAYQPQSKLNPYPIETVREIRMDAHIMPNEAGRKVYILYGVDSMSAQSQNGLLKILEEPPAYVVFILTCESKAALLDTIISRVSLFKCGSDDADAVPDDPAAYDAAVKICLSLTENGEYPLLCAVSAAASDKRLMLEVIPVLKSIFREVYRAKLGLGTADESAKKLAAAITLKSAVQLIDAVGLTQTALERNANMNLTSVLMCANLRRAVSR